MQPERKLQTATQTLSQRLINNVPLELRRTPQWVLWRKVIREGQATKVPFQKSGKAASSTDPTTWSRFEDLSGCTEGFGGVGFVFTESDSFIGIDFDGCRNPDTGEIKPWAREAITLLNSYTEVSPTGTGAKVYAITDGRWTFRNKSEPTDEEGFGGKRPGWEVYTQGRYFCVTGLRLAGLRLLRIIPASEIAEILGVKKNEAIRQQIEWKNTSVTDRATKYLARMEPSVSGQRGHDRLFAAACVLILGFSLDPEVALGVLASEFNPRCTPAWSERELIHKVRQAEKQPGARGYMLDVPPTKYDFAKLPYYKSPQPIEPPVELRLTTLQDAAFAYLEQVREGKQSLIETGIPDLDYAIGGGLQVGEMMIIAGRPNHGKSAIALQMLHHATGNGLPCVMISEEMSALSLGKRAIQFASPIAEEYWKHDCKGVLKDVTEHFAEREKAVIIESCGTITRACEEIERVVKDENVKIAFVDYAQILSSHGKSRYDQVTEVSQQLRRITSRLEIVTVVLAQMNRGIEDRKTFTPVMRDLKESGQLEQDADVVLFGVWPHRINSKKSPNEYQFYVGKNRNRGIMTASFQCYFAPSRQMLTTEKVRSESRGDAWEPEGAVEEWTYE